MRKKYDQVSTLHVIHHGVMPLSTWFGVKFTPGMFSLLEEYPENQNLIIHNVYIQEIIQKACKKLGMVIRFSQYMTDRRIYVDGMKILY
jgi:GNS1/SUR4 family.